MIACCSPAYSSANHTINTLRYSDRLKEKTKMNLQNQNNNNANIIAPSNNNGVKKEISNNNIDVIMGDIREDNTQNFGSLEMDVIKI